jgi:TRAP-type C4-dicarboxylate transport system substrate-binding protein
MIDHATRRVHGGAKLGRRRFLSFAGAAIAAPAFVRSARGESGARAPEVTLKLHHFFSAVSHGHGKLLLPWAKKVEADSGGRIRIDIFPSMQLGGAPARLFDQVRSGVIDIASVVPGNSPGRFPGIEAFELPFVAARSSLANSKGLQAFAEAHLRDEFAEVHPLFFWAHDRGVIHARRSIARLEDLKGLKVRGTTRLAGEALDALGASAVAVPLLQVPHALAHKIIDACALPWELAPAARIPELLRFHSELAGSPTLTTTTFVLAMNKASYDSLPVDLGTVLDANSGQAAAAVAGAVWDAQAAVVEQAVRTRGNTIATIAADEARRWRAATEPVIGRWLEQMKDRGRDGGKLIESARELTAKFETA